MHKLLFINKNIQQEKMLDLPGMQTIMRANFKPANLPIRRSS